MASSENSRTVRVAVCEAHPDLEPGSFHWGELAGLVKRTKSDLLLLNEMPFGPWIAADPEPDPAVFDGACLLHDKGVSRLEELGATTVLSTRPTRLAGLPVNEAFAWSRHTGLRPLRTKQYFPDEAGYYEARWFRAGARDFRVRQAGDARIGVLICTEVMFNEHARSFGRRGANLIAVPRAVGDTSLSRWLVAMQMAAIASGCFVITSNRGGRDRRGQVFGGRGWVIDPFGVALAETSPKEPVVVVDIDLGVAARARLEYPCYIPELLD